MGLKIFQVDAFSNRSFAGNPAGVVPEAKGLTREARQKIAMEMNLAETAFIEQLADDLFDVKFFTPTEEVDLCGHATIASFYLLASRHYITPIDSGVKKVIQQTNIGDLPVYITYEAGVPSMIYMVQSTPKRFGGVKDLDQLLDALSLKKEDVGIEGFNIGPEIVSTGLRDILVPIRSEAVLDRLKMNKDLLIKVSKENNVTGVHLYMIKDFTQNIIKARNMAPAAGVDEEAATGTSNGALLYLLNEEELIVGSKMVVYQGESLGRESFIYCEMREQQILVGGEAKIILEGYLLI